MYRILSLDGGGAWALIEVQALTRLFGGGNTRGHDVLRQFDLVAANSGGSLVLGGLVENLTLGEVADLFLSAATRSAIFSKVGMFEYQVDKALNFGPKYRSDAKLDALKRILVNTGGTPFNELHVPGRSGDPIHLLVTAYEYDSNRAAFFRSGGTSGPAWGEGASSTVTLAEALHASSNAPINFFDAPAKLDSCDQRLGWSGVRDE